MPPALFQAHRQLLGESGTPLGTATWMVPAEARNRLGFNDRLFELTDDGIWQGRSDGQIWLGEAIDSEAGALGYTDDRHVCVVSSTRGGKGTGLIIPNLCLWSGSCIVIDPKGENATVTARRRGQGSEYALGLGQTVRILDPFGEVQLDPSLKARFNPLDVIDPASDYAIDDAGLVAGSLVVVENRNDPFWEEAARDLIKCLILHVLSDDDFVERRNLVSVWRLLNQGDWVSIEALRDSGEKDIPSGFDLLWQGMKRNNAFGGLVAGAGDQFASMAEKTRSSVLGSARASLEFMSGPPMQRLLETSDFDLAALKTDPRGLTIYLTLPQRYMNTHFRWLRLMISLAVGEMERIKTVPATGYPTLFILDEFAGLKRMETIEHAAAQAAGFGAKFFFVVQNLTQLKEAYKDSWETFLGNSGLKLFFNIEDDFTRSYVTRQVGEQEVRRSSRSGSTSQSESQSLSQSLSQSQSFSDSTSASTSRSSTFGRSSSSTTGTSDSVTRGRNTGRSISDTDGWSDGTSYTWSGWLRLFTSSESKQRGNSGSRSKSNSVGWSNSTALSRSRSLSESLSESEALSGSNSQSQSQSKSNSASTSRSTSQSVSSTDGWSEAVHKRPLLNPDEVGRLLARVDDRDDPGYPGILLALMPGRHPLLVRRVNYFESRRFVGFFDPHPGHPPPPTLAELRSFASIAAKMMAEALAKTKGSWSSARVLVGLSGTIVIFFVVFLLLAGASDRHAKKAAQALPLTSSQLISQAYAAVQGGNDTEAYQDFLLVQNAPEAQFWLGVIQARGHIGPVNYPAAYGWFVKAANQNYAPAKTWLGMMYVNGLGRPTDYVEARRWLQMAVDQGDPAAYQRLGELDWFGRGGARNSTRALDLIGKAAAAGYAGSKEWLALQQLPTSELISRANAAMKSGNAGEADRLFYFAQNDAEAQFWLGVIQAEGANGPVNYGAAYDWFMKAASQNHARAKTWIGVMYANGLGLRTDAFEARRWLLFAVNQGDPAAYQKLGELYWFGLGGERDPARALDLIGKAAAAGYAGSKEWLASPPDYTQPINRTGQRK
jgi:type IV secretory pathway TraG/TraD family ATPase VirD4/TPR repeat protein